MSAGNVCRSGSGLCLTAVERALAHSRLHVCGPGRSDDCDSFRDKLHDSGCSDQQVVDLDISEVRENYALDHPPPVTHSLPYVTQQHVVDHHYFQQTASLLDFDLGCLDAAEHDPSFSETTLEDPATVLSVLNSGDPLSLGCVGTMPSSNASTAAVSNKVVGVGKRKKDAPHRRKHPAGTTVPTHPVTTEKPMDDFSRLVDYVPDCLERFGFCVVDKFAGKSLATSVCSEVLALYERESFEGGLLTSQAFALTAVRGDRVFWLEHEDDRQCAGICQLIGRLDDLFLRLRGRLGSYHISSRSKVGCVEILYLVVHLGVWVICCDYVHQNTAISHKASFMCNYCVHL